MSTADSLPRLPVSRVSAIRPSAMLVVMDAARKPGTPRKERLTADRAAENGQSSRNDAPRANATAVLDGAASNGAESDDRSPERQSFDELMESRRAESRAVWRAFLGPLLSQAEVQDLIGAAS